MSNLNDPMPCPVCKKMHAPGEREGREVIKCECGVTLRYVVPFFKPAGPGYLWQIEGIWREIARRKAPGD